MISILKSGIKTTEYIMMSTIQYIQLRPQYDSCSTLVCKCVVRVFVIYNIDPIWHGSDFRVMVPTFYR